MEDGCFRALHRTATHGIGMANASTRAGTIGTLLNSVPASSIHLTRSRYHMLGINRSHILKSPSPPDNQPTPSALTLSTTDGTHNLEIKCCRLERNGLACPLGQNISYMVHPTDPTSSADIGASSRMYSS